MDGRPELRRRRDLGWQRATPIEEGLEAVTVPGAAATEREMRLDLTAAHRGESAVDEIAELLEWGMCFGVVHHRSSASIRSLRARWSWARSVPSANPVSCAISSWR